MRRGYACYGTPPKCDWCQKPCSNEESFNNARQLHRECKPKWDALVAAERTRLRTPVRNLSAVLYAFYAIAFAVLIAILRVTF